jgi:hypothetical protein
MRILLAFTATLLTGCGATYLSTLASSPEIKPGEEFDLGIGGMARLAGTGFHVVFDKVLEDSRCPMNARCIWEGNAKVLVLFGDLSAQAFELNTSERFSTRGHMGDWDIVLVHLEPTPMTGEKVKKYVATLRVEPRP